MQVCLHYGGHFNRYLFPAWRRKWTFIKHLLYARWNTQWKRLVECLAFSSRCSLNESSYHIVSVALRDQGNLPTMKKWAGLGWWWGMLSRKVESIPVLIFGDYIFLGICPFLLGCPFYWYILKIALLRDNLYTIKFTHFKFTVHWVFANLLSCVTIIIIQFRKFCHNPPKKKEKKKKKKKVWIRKACGVRL